MRTSSKIYVCLVSAVIGFQLGCGPGGKLHTGRVTNGVVTISSVTATPNVVAPNTPFTIDTKASTTGTTGLTYLYSQPSGPTAAVNNGTAANPINLTTPGPGPAAFMTFQVEVKEGTTGSPVTQTVNVLFNGTHQHRLVMRAIDNAPGQPDAIEASIVQQANGQPPVPNAKTTVTLTYNVTMLGGVTHTVNQASSLQAPGFNQVTPLVSTTGVQIELSQVSNITVTPIESDVVMPLLPDNQAPFVGGLTVNRSYP